MKGKTASFVDDFEHRICTMRAYLTEAYRRTWDEGIGLDEVDTEVVLDQVDIALERTWIALDVLHPEFRGLDDVVFEEVVCEMEERHAFERSRRKDDAREDLELILLLVGFGAVGVLERASGWKVRSAADVLIDEMSIVVEIVELIGYVLDPSAAEQPTDDLTPEERVRVASRLEEHELLLDECRRRAAACLAYTSGTREV